MRYTRTYTQHVYLKKINIIIYICIHIQERRFSASWCTVWIHFAMKLPMAHLISSRRLARCQAKSDVPVMQPAAPEVEAPPRRGSQLGPVDFSILHGTWRNDLQNSEVLRGTMKHDETDVLFEGVVKRRTEMSKKTYTIIYIYTYKQVTVILRPLLPLQEGRSTPGRWRGKEAWLDQGHTMLSLVGREDAYVMYREI